MPHRWEQGVGGRLRSSCGLVSVPHRCSDLWWHIHAAQQAQLRAVAAACESGLVENVSCAGQIGRAAVLLSPSMQKEGPNPVQGLINPT